VDAEDSIRTASVRDDRLDYPRGRLVLESDRWRPRDDAGTVALHFQVDEAGRRKTHFPRVEIRVDGEPLEVLLDTGAETLLTDAALRSVGDDLPAFRASSMIQASVFDAWHRRHPDWRWIDDAETVTHAPMIQVPGVEIAGYTVGPVWFTRRPDANFTTFMSSMMDAPVVGSIGGNALGAFRMTIDYPRAAATFVCVSGCRGRPATPIRRSDGDAR
jgi:hypothetical protein